MVKYHKDCRRYKYFECSTDLYYTGAVIKAVLSRAHTPVYTCLLCKSTPKLLSQKSLWPRGGTVIWNGDGKVELQD